MGFETVIRDLLLNPENVAQIMLLKFLKKTCSTYLNMNSQAEYIVRVNFKQTYN